MALAIILGGGYFLVDQGVGFLSDLNSGADDYSGAGTGSVVVEIPEGATLTDMGDTLAEADVVASTEAFTEVAGQHPDATGIQPGFYEMREQMSAEEALALLLSGKNRVESVVTVPEGLTVEQILELVAEETGTRLKAYESAAAKPNKLGLPEYARGDLEGYLFPATYTLPPKTSPTEVLEMMVEKFKAEADRLGLEAGAQQLGYTPHEMVTVASIVQREARRSEDFPKVARVIYNRLDVGMPLQMDSTVHYATDSVGDVFTTVEQRAVDSPYNTYRFPGLPPGAISAGGAEALKAALEPAEGDWTYFLTVDLETGETKFATSLREHNRNKQELHEYCATSDLC